MPLLMKPTNSLTVRLLCMAMFLCLTADNSWGQRCYFFVCAAGLKMCVNYPCLQIVSFFSFEKHVDTKEFDSFFFLSQ